MNYIGIDFGTHYTTITNADSQILEYNIPSIIHIGEQIIIGEDAVNLNNISYFKRLLCLKENENYLFNYNFYNVNETIYIKTDKGDLSITQIIGIFFSKLNNF